MDRWFKVHGPCGTYVKCEFLRIEVSQAKDTGFVVKY